jgi:GNAT superfamily N-acetyltransferase
LESASKDIGIFPDGAFTDYAARRQILIGSAAGVVTGYLIYRVSDDRALIVHLCTSDKVRGTGVARALVDSLKLETRTRGLRGIGLSCRVDFEANKVWPRLGFTPIHERAGRSKEGTVLTYWWFDHGLPDLFSSATKSDLARVVAAIDANIFFDLVTARSQGDESRALNADWLQPELELCVADEIYHEINRGDDESERRRCRERCNNFRVLTPTDDRFLRKQAEVKALFGDGTSVQEKSDRAHLAKAAATGVQVFLTRDEELLQRAEEIHERVGLEVMRPSSLIGRIDELRRSAAYEPAKLAGSSITLKRMVASEVEDLPSQLSMGVRGEKLADFRRTLRSMLAYPDRNDAFVVRDGTVTLAVITFSRINPHTITVARIRVQPGSLNQTLGRHLVLRSIQEAIDRKATWVRVEDNYLTTELESALAEHSFFRTKRAWVRCAMRVSGNLNEVITKLLAAEGGLAEDVAAISSEIDRLRSEPAALAQELERVFWPAKVYHSGIKTFAVAIHPKWAQHFFDSQIAGQELFGADPWLALNREHVYYRSANRCGLTAPARVLWYVTKDGDFEGSMSIRACSRLVGIEVDKPKPLFRRYERLGVYVWQNIFATADNSIDNDIMALRFVDTEVFTRPITLKEAKQFGIRANFESPVRIDESIFRSVYDLGLSTPPTNE